MADFILAKNKWEKFRFLKRLFNGLDKMILFDSGDSGFFLGEKAPDDSLDIGRRGLRILKKAFKIEDRPLGIGEKIARDQDLVDHLRFRIDGDRDPDQSARGLQNGGQGLSS